MWVKSSYSTSAACVEVWRKSSHSAEANCVEVSTVEEVKVRDSKNPDAGHLTFTSAAWKDFLRDITSD